MTRAAINSEALGPGSVLVSRGRRESLGKGNVFSIELKTATGSLLRTVFSSDVWRIGSLVARVELSRYEMKAVYKLLALGQSGGHLEVRCYADLGQNCLAAS